MGHDVKHEGHVVDGYAVDGHAKHEGHGDYGVLTITVAITTATTLIAFRRCASTLTFTNMDRHKHEHALPEAWLQQ